MTAKKVYDDMINYYKESLQEGETSYYYSNLFIQSASLLASLDEPNPFKEEEDDKK